MQLSLSVEKCNSAHDIFILDFLDAWILNFENKILLIF